MRTTKSGTKYPGGLAILAAAGIVAYSGHRLHVQASHIPRSIWTKQQIYEHALPLIQTFVPEQNQIAIEINENTAYRVDGTPRHLCFVDSTGDSAGHAIHTVWDTDTGKLIQVGKHPAEQTDMQM